MRENCREVELVGPQREQRPLVDIAAVASR